MCAAPRIMVVLVERGVGDGSGGVVTVATVATVVVMAATQ